MVACLIFDVDGVLVDSPHESAWGESVSVLARDRWHTAHDPYDTDIYQRFVAGRPRLEGARGLLAAVGIPDPDGSRAFELAEVKQRRIVELIEAGKFKAFPDALGMALRSEAAGITLAVASSSKNANAMLRQVLLPDGRSLFDFFPANVCGRDFPEGKPHPDIFLAAAEAAGVAPEGCVVVEDAPNGVLAARRAGMGCVGVARLGDEKLLAAAGADRVVTDLSTLDPRDL